MRGQTRALLNWKRSLVLAALGGVLVLAGVGCQYRDMVRLCSGMSGDPEVQACQDKRADAWFKLFEEGCVEGDSAKARATLTALYHATGGPQWTASDNWLTDAPLGYWHGVGVMQCEGAFNSISYLRLEGNNLAGQLPAELGDLGGLWALDLSHNDLTGPIPPGIYAEHELDLSNNRLTGRIPDSLSGRSFRHLDLSNNQLSGPLPAVEMGTFFGEQGKGQLYLNDNRLTGPIPANYGQFPFMQAIGLGGTNRITGCRPDGLGAYESDLKSLRLPDCEDTEKEALIALYHATGGPNWTDNRNWLDFEWGEVMDESPFDFWHGVELHYLSDRVIGLDLSDNGLEGELPPELGNLVHLEELDLSGNRLTGEIPPELGSLFQGQVTDFSGPVLDLSNNRLSGEIPPELGQMSQVEGLFLTGNRLTGEIPPELGNLTRLEWMKLDDNRLTGEAPTELCDLPQDPLIVLWDNEGLIGCPPLGARAGGPNPDP